MKLPTQAQLAEVAAGLWGTPFGELSVTDRVLCVQIAQSAVMASVIDDLPTNLSISFAETLVEYGPKFAKLIEQVEEVANQLSEIDKSLSWLEPVADWFKYSDAYKP